MKVIIRKDYNECAEYVAKHIEKRILEAKPSRENPFVLGLPTGSTPLGVYKKLIEKVKSASLSFKDVVTFNMDEYVGLEETNEQSYHYFMYHNFFNHIDIAKENVHILDGMANDLEKECNEYEKKISLRKISLFFGGVGSDGHIAFNEPCSSLSSRTRVKNLTIETIEANSRFFENNSDKVPKRALTVGIGTIMDAKEVLIMATGRAKAKAIKHAIEGSVNHLWTISALQLHKNAILVCDDEAMEEVKVKTYKYFKEIEKSIQ